ncbi:glycosyl hydrolase [Tenuifilaceae bacterium CYCD]|nr:glycosyl hydrolase [Tenuifilaceae bacterium CYCD]
MNIGIKIIAFLTCCTLLSKVNAQSYQFPFQNPDLSLEERLDDIISRLTLDEKVLLMQHNAPAIDRLAIPAYNWWNEALHGVARTKEYVTVFPQAIALAATFNPDGLQKTADIISTEGRAIFNDDFKNGKTGENYRGLTYWTPNINIFRDPRWGRGQETYGEDPYLTSVMGGAMVRGLEGDDPNYLKAVACAKHFAVHSGPEHNRHSFNVTVSAYDLWDTYLPAFKHLVVNEKVHGVMCAYNRFVGTPCCANDTLLNDILRKKWGFDGYVTTDCWAISDFLNFHNTHSSEIEAISDALLSGSDLECGSLYHKLIDAVKLGYITEKQVNISLRRLLKIEFQLGIFDPQEIVPFASIDRSKLDCNEHKQHAYLMAKQSIVLLKNENRVLPLDENRIKHIAIIGPNANNPKTLLANYNGTPSSSTTPYQSLLNRYGNKLKITFFQGVGIVDTLSASPSFSEISKSVSNADVILFIGGISANYEGEAGDAGAGGYFGFASGDRTTMALPKVQTELLKKLKKINRPIVLINMSGSSISFEWENQNVDAILQVWYGGQSAGDAIVDVIFGKYNPAGRMPITTYKSDTDLPDFEDYSMENRTYRYYKGEVRYPFGYGLSYAEFAYSNLKFTKEINTGNNLEVEVEVQNTGKISGDEVVQLYTSHINSTAPTPICALKAFKRVSLNQGEKQKVIFLLTPTDLAKVDLNGKSEENSGKINIFVGGGQPKYANGLSDTLTVSGNPVIIK